MHLLIFKLFNMDDGFVCLYAVILNYVYLWCVTHANIFLSIIKFPARDDLIGVTSVFQFIEDKILKKKK